jgi:SH3-like domain-containing protein
MRGITTHTLNVRKGPGKENEVLWVLHKGAEFKLMAEKNGWGEISYQNRLGFVMMDFVDKIDEIVGPEPENTAPKRRKRGKNEQTDVTA